MQLSDVIESRRSIRKYKADPVPDEHVIRVLNAARIAPSAANRQPWHFIVVQDKETRGKKSGVKGNPVKVRYFLKKIEGNWKIIEYEVFGKDDDIPPIANERIWL